MKLLISATVFIWAVMLGLGGFYLISSPVRADNPPPVQIPPQQNPDLFQYNGQPLQQYSKDNAALKQVGVWEYRLVNVKGCPADSITPAIIRAVTSTRRWGVNPVLSNSASAHVVYENCGASFANVCGGPPVIGCLGRGFPYDNDVDISTDMAVYFDDSQEAIACHEICGHAMGVWNEQYKLDGTFGSSSDVTIMNTGPLSRHKLGTAEDARWWRTMGSPELDRQNVGYDYNGAWFIWGCGFHFNTTRLSVLVDRHDGAGIVWAGVIKAIPTTNGRLGDANGCLGIGPAEGLDIIPGNLYLLKQENPASYLVSHNEACVRGSIGCS